MSKVEATLLIMVLIMSVSMISINVTAEGDDIIIESDMTWNDEMSLSQNVRVLNMIEGMNRLAYYYENRQARPYDPK